MARSMLDTVSLAGTLVFAIPVAILGVEYLVAGRTLLGGAFLAIALAMVLVVEFLAQPKELAMRAASGLFGRGTDATEENE